MSSSNYDAHEDDGGCCIANCDSTDSNARIDKNPCTISIEVDKKMTAPVYMYYKLTNFYQNHRRYVKSRDDPQLRGMSDLAPDTVKTNCEYRFEVDGDGSSTAMLNVLNPCGLIAWSLFNDSFAFARHGGASVAATHKGIAWSTDVEKKFKNARDGSTGLNYPPFAAPRAMSCQQGFDSMILDPEQYNDCVEADNDAQEAARDLPTDEGLPIGSVTGRPYLRPGLCYPGSGHCTEDEHFIVWMRTAGLPSFRKLYLKLEEDLEPGTYEVTISNGVAGTVRQDNVTRAAMVNPHTGAEQTSLYPTGVFRGQKFVVLSTTGWIGGKNNFLGLAYIIVGSVCVALALAFLLKNRCSPRDPGSAQYINSKNKTPPGEK